MMAAEGPFLAAIIARLAAPEKNLAAFAVASSLAWMVESPIIMMLSASNALVRDGVAYRKLRRFSYALNAAVTAVMLLLVIPPVFRLIAVGAMGLEPGVVRLAGQAMFCLVLWPGSIGFRRFYQGILIGDGQLANYGTEHIAEAYYRAQLLGGLAASADYQLLMHPAYNRDRGPVSVFALRLHTQF